MLGTGVVSNGRHFEADVVILAAALGIPDLAQPVGLSVPLTAKPRTVTLITKPLKPLLRHIVVTGKLLDSWLMLLRVMVEGSKIECSQGCSCHCPVNCRACIQRTTIIHIAFALSKVLELPAMCCSALWYGKSLFSLLLFQDLCLLVGKFISQLEITDTKSMVL